MDGEGTIVAGHGRVLAARQLGMTEVPTISLARLSEAQRRAYVIADNKLALQSGWDADVLALELSDLQQQGFAMDLTGFDADEMLGITNPKGKRGKTEDDDAPHAPAKPASRLGDVWVLGQHRVMCGDSTAQSQVDVLVGDRQADMLLTDPPYNVDYQGGTKGKLKIKGDKQSDSGFRLFLGQALSAASQVMKAGAVFYIWYADVEAYNFTGALVDTGWQLRQVLIWKKSSLVMGRKDYHFKHEPCLYGWKDGAAHHWASDRKQTTVLEFDRPMRNDVHPTMKPVALFEYLMLNNTKHGDLVLDTFGGSGTTLIAAEKHERQARLMELDPKYCDVIVQRWQDFTGKAAVLESTSATFEATKEQRG